MAKGFQGHIDIKHPFADAGLLAKSNRVMLYLLEIGGMLHGTWPLVELPWAACLKLLSYQTAECNDVRYMISALQLSVSGETRNGECPAGLNVGQV